MLNIRMRVQSMHQGYLIILLFFALLNGCATHVKRDGPPPFNVDVSKIPNAVPKVEPLSKYGNYEKTHGNYIVYGKKYHVMPSSKHYEERGIASWYGTLFHDHLTSSGERYDMLAMTAAHKSLPLPTYVSVTNLKNGRQIIVKVNDRGPFKPHRIIDLSYAAAKKLGMLAHGTAYVDVKAIDPLHPDQAYPERYYFASRHATHPSVMAHHRAEHFMMASTAHPHAIKQHASNEKSHTRLAETGTFFQVGAFTHRMTAEKVKKRLSQHIASPIHIQYIAHAQQPYRIQIGPIHNKRVAMRVHNQLKALKMNSITMIV